MLGEQYTEGLRRMADEQAAVSESDLRPRAEGVASRTVPVREVLAVVLTVAGVALVSWGGFLVAPWLGLILTGVCVGLVGLLLGND